MEELEVLQLNHFETLDKERKDQVIEMLKKYIEQGKPSKDSEPIILHINKSTYLHMRVKDLNIIRTYEGDTCTWFDEPVVAILYDIFTDKFPTEYPIDKETHVIDYAHPKEVKDIPYIIGWNYDVILYKFYKAMEKFNPLSSDYVKDKDEFIEKYLGIFHSEVINGFGYASWIKGLETLYKEVTNKHPDIDNLTLLECHYRMYRYKFTDLYLMHDETTDDKFITERVNLYLSMLNTGLHKLHRVHKGILRFDLDGYYTESIYRAIKKFYKSCFYESSGTLDLFKKSYSIDRPVEFIDGFRHELHQYYYYQNDVKSDLYEAREEPTEYHEPTVRI